MKIKICGIRRKEDIAYVNEAGPDYIGFVFADTRRKVTPEQAGRLRDSLDSGIKAVGVYVNAPVGQVADCVRAGSIDAVQLHGDETEEYIQRLREELEKVGKVVPVIKAVRVRSREDILAADRLSCDGLLLDTYSAIRYGGTGRTFSWDVIPEKLAHPYFLAGGLDAGNVRAALGSTGCAGVDVSGGVETEGVKDPEKIKEFVRIVRSFGTASDAEQIGRNK